MANPTDHLTAVRAALDDVRAWCVECDEPILRTSDGEAADWIASWDHDSIRASADDAIQELVDRGHSVEAAEEMVRVISLIPAAPAIAALADECERLRARIAKAEEVVAAARTLGSYAWTDRLDDSRTSDDAKEDESKLSSAVWQYDNPPNLHPDGCHTTAASAFRDCSGDGHHECRTCTRFDEDERAKRIGEE